MLPAASRHSRPSKPAARFGVPVLAVAAIAAITGSIVLFHGGAAPGSAADRDIAAARATSTMTVPGFADDQITVTARSKAAVRQARQAARARLAAHRRHLAAQAAAARAAAARAAAARQAAARQRAAAQSSPAPSASAPAAPSSGGGNAADSSLGICIRNAEEGGSYAWGPGNGGGAYQFAEGTWENYGGAASEFGVAGPSYQDQIFDNAIAAGGASNWTDYDGC